MRQRLVSTVLGVAAMLAATSCSESQTGTPILGSTPATATSGTTGPATSSSGPTTSGSGNRYGAPPVTNPLDVTKFLPKPCAALTPQQLRDFNLPAQGEPDTDSAIARHTGPSCGWTNSDTSTGIDVHFVTGNKNGLADVYRTHQEGDWKGYWEVTTVDGYPGVFTFTTDGRPRGSCNLFVGISETLAFAAATDGRLKEKSCDLAKQIAAAVVETLKRGG
jgi:hypothetical protein